MIKVHGNIWIEEYQEGGEAIVLVATDSAGTSLKTSDGGYYTTTTDSQGSFSLNVPEAAYVKAIRIGLKPLQWKASQLDYPQKLFMYTTTNTLPEVTIKPKPDVAKTASTGMKLGFLALLLVGFKKAFS